MFLLSFKLQQQKGVYKKRKMLQANYIEIYDRLIFLYSSIPNTFLISFYALLLLLRQRCYLYQTSAVTRISAL